MTKKACDELNSLTTTGLQALVRVQLAWNQALSDVWLVVQDELQSETDETYVSNQSEVDIPAQPNATTLVASALTRSGSPPATIAAGYATISPATLPVGTSRTVLVTVVPPAGTEGGTYVGTVDDAAGTSLALLSIIVTSTT